MNQTSLTFGRMQMDAGIERVTRKAGDAWLGLAYAWVELYVQRLQRGAEFTAEMLVEASVEHGIMQAHSDKAWAGPILRAKRNGLIEKVEGKTGVCRKRHNSVCVLWRKR